MSQSSLPDNEELTENIKFLQKLHENCINTRNSEVLEAKAAGPVEYENYVKNYCLTAFDGWTCWNVTPAGETAVKPCPAFVTGFDPTRSAFRECLSNGSWFRHPESGHPWTNYTNCIDLDDLKFREFVNTLYISGYTLSLVALIISLIIFTYFRSLRCTRIAIHIHLFMSLALNNIGWLIWYKLVVHEPDAVLENAPFCQVLHIILQYLMVSNYMWMFCEGLHLHLALVVVFIRDGYAMKWFYFIGWIVPIFITCAYVIARYSNPEDTQHCWLHESYASWVIILPVLISILISLMFLMNVMRILLTKLHSNSTNPAPIGMKKAARAAFILIPLFGLHYIFLPFRPEDKSTAEKVYDVLSALLVSLQGLCVSVLFCFANVDVHVALKLSYKKLQRTGTNLTHVTATTQQQQTMI